MISENNIRIFSTIPKELKDIIEKDAKENFRTISSQVYKIIADYYSGKLKYINEQEEKK